MDSDQLWHRYPTGLRLTVCTEDSNKLAGVRNGVLEYLQAVSAPLLPYEVLAEDDRCDSSHIPLSDRETITRALQRARELATRGGTQELGAVRGAQDFFLCVEGGVQSVELSGSESGETSVHFVQTWVAIVGPDGEALGSGGSTQIPSRLTVANSGGREVVPFAIPGTRRRGGLAGSLGGGPEWRRRSVCIATQHALSTLLYDVVGRRPTRRN